MISAPQIIIFSIDAEKSRNNKAGFVRSAVCSEAENNQVDISATS
jgi:hypothetical protein